MKSLNDLFDAYSKDHQHPVNQKIHYICVPLIVYSVLGILWTLPTPEIFPDIFNWAIIITTLSVIYYLILSIKLALAMIVFATLCLGSFVFLQSQSISLLYLNIVVFTLAWAGQFYGHKIEGKKPSFLTDLTYLLIGPLWVLEKAFRRNTEDAHIRS